ncbi:MAG: uroporphyrinogen III methyltransferase/synthase [Nonlabens sp.]
MAADQPMPPRAPAVTLVPVAPAVPVSLSMQPSHPGAAQAAAAGPPAAPGVVHLVGVGPGDTGLVTLRAAQLLATADVIAHDKLVPADVLALASVDAEFLDVGRRADGPYAGRDAVDQLLVSAALAGRSVVRVKGGDPFVFGRGAEEARALAAAGIPVEIVPGVTSAVAVPAAAGIPVTLRGVAPGVAIVTGHEDPTKDATQLDIDALAAFPGTLVVLMGRRALPRLTARLIAAGRAPTTPAAIVAQGGWPGQLLVDGTLADLAELAEAAQVPTPAVVVIGEVVAHRLPQADRATRPLHGVQIALPRLTDEPSRLAVALQHAGAVVHEPHVLTTHPAAAAPLRAAARAIVAVEVDTVVITSMAAAETLLDALVEVGADVRALASVQLWVSGRRTALRLARAGLVADWVTDGPATLRAAPPDGAGRVLVLAADAADGGIADALAATGAVATRVSTSMTVPTGVPLAAPGAVAIIAASRLAACVVGHDGPVIALGPSAATACRQLGVHVTAVAAEPTPAAAIAAVCRLLDAGRVHAGA